MHVQIELLRITYQCRTCGHRCTVLYIVWQLLCSCILWIIIFYVNVCTLRSECLAPHTLLYQMVVLGLSSLFLVQKGMHS